MNMSKTFIGFGNPSLLDQSLACKNEQVETFESVWQDCRDLILVQGLDDSFRQRVIDPPELHDVEDRPGTAILHHDLKRQNNPS